MREFFHSWNRQAGCVTLVMALAVTGTWVRSLCCYDHVDFAIGDRQHIIYSLNGALSWWSWDLTGDRATRRTNGWGSMFIPEGGGFSGTTLTPKQFRPASVSLDYWTIAIPLTIASALLLLSNPGRLVKWCSSLSCLRRSKHHQQRRVPLASPIYPYGLQNPHLQHVTNSTPYPNSHRCISNRFELRPMNHSTSS